jgi:hypothetical protein
MLRSIESTNPTPVNQTIFISQTNIEQHNTTTPIEKPKEEVKQNTQPIAQPQSTPTPNPIKKEESVPKTDTWQKRQTPKEVPEDVLRKVLE